MSQNSFLVNINTEFLEYLLNGYSTNRRISLSLITGNSTALPGFTLSTASSLVTISSDSDNVILTFSPVSKTLSDVDLLATACMTLSTLFFRNVFVPNDSILRSFILVWDSMLSQFPNSQLLVSMSKTTNCYSLNVVP